VSITTQVQQKLRLISNLILLNFISSANLFKLLFIHYYEGVNSMLTDSDKPVANPLVVLREEFDDWAILFDPDSGVGFGLNPVGVFIWKQLDGRNTVQDITAELCEKCENIPEDAQSHVKGFINDLVEQGLAGYELLKV
jgi:SynChlorMet cassette protein ScmD